MVMVAAISHCIFSLINKIGKYIISTLKFQKFRMILHKNKERKKRREICWDF